jgi:CheY-like chemotaxis protein
MVPDQKKVILAVDDDATCLTILREILDGPFEVFFAKSAKTAKNILKVSYKPVDLILLDMEMPDISGLEFFNDLKKEPDFCHIPVIFVSSHESQDIMHQVLESDAKGFAVKPVIPEQLLEKINAVLATTP